MATMDSVRAIATLKKAASEMINFFDCPLGQLVDSEEMSLAWRRVPNLQAAPSLDRTTSFSCGVYSRC
jgi:hypothetical protein